MGNGSGSLVRDIRHPRRSGFHRNHPNYREVILSDNIYHVIINRRLQAGQVQLNFVDAERANHAFAKIGTLKERHVFTDDFAAKLNLDPEDIGNILFMDGQRTLEFQGEIALLQQRIQRQTQAKVEAMPIVPRASLMVPAGTKFGT